MFVLSIFFMAHSALAAPAESVKMNSFIDHLLSKMTVEEKVGQMNQVSAEMAITGPFLKGNYREEIKKGLVGSVLNAVTPKFTRELQEVAINSSRLKIPMLFAYDVIHGYKTIFPIPLGESASWDLKGMEQSARVAATEAAADGVHWTFAPMVDVARDPRWGRISEGPGEDPWLASQIAVAKIHGFQGEKLGSVDTIIACVKHFAAYGAVLAGRDYNTVQMTDRELMETYFPPFEAAVKAGVRTLMPAFNDIGGVSTTANEFLLRKTLRDKWKFKGVTVSDWTAIPEMITRGTAADEFDAAAQALRAGVDMDMEGRVYISQLPKLIKQHKVPIALVNAAVRRILTLKYEMGLFTEPYRYSDEGRSKRVLFSDENLQIARESARRSIVLLKNEGAVLPLKKSGTIALIGPFVMDRLDINGNWAKSGDTNQSVTLLEGFQKALGDKAKILYAKGANILEPGPMFTLLNNKQNGAGLEVDKKSKEQLIKEAVDLAKQADVVVVALGETQNMSGEAASRTRIRLPENQQALLAELKAKAGKPIVLLLSNGRPLVLEAETHQADAIVETWFLGTESGHAIADVLFGDYNPSAHLTVTYPSSEGQIPIFYSARSTGRPYASDNWYSTKYIDSSNDPLFPFGFGLSYTTFAFSPPKLSSDKMRAGDTLKVKVTVSNTGTTDGEEVVQMYVRDLTATVSRPVKVLRGFTKVFLHRGENREVTLELNAEDLKFYNRDLKWVVEPGSFQVFVGGNSRDVQETSFTYVR